MKPILEKLAPSKETSWTMLNRQLDDSLPFQWHHHPEFELTLTLNSRGQRFIGDHIGQYDDGDLVLIGPNLPHSWSSSEKISANRPHIALVMWFSPDWVAALSATFVEFKAVREMLDRATTGLTFSAAVAHEARQIIEALFSQPADERLLSLMRVLQLLARDSSSLNLASPNLVPDLTVADRARIDKILDHLHRHYATEITVAALANFAALSPSGLHRLFWRHTQMTISDYIMRLRIGEACAMLSSSSKPIHYIADATGYRSLANFNRQFKRLKGTTPRAYRQHFTTPTQ